MKKFLSRLEILSKQKYFRVFVFFFVLYFTFVLRAHNSERVPTANHLDEMLYAWSGIHLIETGVPVSWSTLDYPERAEVYRGRISFNGGIPEAYVTLYKPWLDEPPLFSLIVGYFAHLFGADRDQFIPASYIRFPIVIFSTIVSVIVFAIARKLSGFWTGILAMLVYGTVPLFVFASRTAMPESFIALLYITMVYLLLKFKEKFRFYFLAPIPILAGIAGLSKPTGYFILPFALYLVFLWLYRKNKLKLAIKYCLYLVLATLPFVIAYFWYGISQDAEIFWRLNSIQSHRPVGFGSLMWFFISPAYDTMVLRDSWYVFCLVSAAYFLFVKKSFEKRIISFAFVYWVIIVMISGGENDLLAWYRFPSFPFLAILGAWGLELLVKKADFFASFLAAGMLLGNRMLLVNAFRPNVSPNTYRFVFSALMAPSLFYQIFKKSWLKNLTRLTIIVIIAAGIFINSIYIYQAFEIACEQKLCPIVPPTFLSTIFFPSFLKTILLEGPKFIDSLFGSL